MGIEGRNKKEKVRKNWEKGRKNEHGKKGE